MKKILFVLTILFFAATSSFSYANDDLSTHDKTQIFSKKESWHLLGKHFASTYHITRTACYDYVDAEEYKKGSTLSTGGRELGEVEVTRENGVYKLFGEYERYYPTERPFDPTEQDGGHVKIDGVITEIHDGYFLFKGQIETLLLDHLSDKDREENTYEACKYPPQTYKFTRLTERQPECWDSRFWSLEPTTLPESCPDYVSSRYINIDILLDHKITP